ncbi:protealysin inhibitor emfourin [Xanthobacter sp. DSM 14520]|uniref:protealysin inhibitor emfourin n=1 Tax=Xanthobacter autotrophicus (strain ATCC BAA-1158 / Py2) TaxID=78245 RepID=UPI00372B95B9
MTDIRIERIGGFAGFGLPGSRLKSRGSLTLDHLSTQDRATISRLFERGTKGSRPQEPDMFRYRLTRVEHNAEMDSIEASESEIPAALISTVRDELD